MSHTFDRVRVLAAAVLFSTGGTAVKLATLSSWQIASFRSGIAALALWLLIPAWRRGFSGRTLAVASAYAATMILYVLANTLTTAANSIFLQNTALLYVVLLAPRLLGEKNQRADLWVVLLIGTGLLAFFVGSEAPVRTAPDPATGNLVAATAGVTWALTLLGMRWLAREPHAPDRDPSGAAIVLGNALAFCVCLPLALPVVASGAGNWALDWAVVGYLGLFQIGVAYVALVGGMRTLRAVEVSLLLMIEPVLSAFWAWLVHSEIPGPWSLAGCALISMGVLVRALRSET